MAKPKSKRPKKVVTQDEELFADNTDIFADLPSAKPKEKKKKASAKSLFHDEDMEDIFANAVASSKKSKKSGTAKKAPTADDENIFDDPLSAATR